MSEQPREPDMAEREAWGPLTCALLGVWLLASPSALGYMGRPMAWSDFAFGGLVLAISLWSARSRRRSVVQWVLCLLGVLLLHAPLVAHTPAAAAYLNSTLVGAGLIAFSVVLPRHGWHGHHAAPDVPTGWTFNPSSWIQRTPIIALAWLNFFLARYLAAYQLDHIDWPWDPFFGDGTQQVLDSAVSEAFPVSDAGLGAAAYVIEALVGYMGASNRWRTAPWTVALFGVLVIPVGAVSTVLMILQPVAVGAWCTICLLAAALMLVMACLALPEVVAMLQYLNRCRHAGRDVWRTFWLGGEDEDDTMEQPPIAFSAPPREVFGAMVCGTTLPWGLALSVLIGAWFVAAPDVLGIPGLIGDAHVVIGALVIVIAALAMSEVLRAARLANILLAAALVVAVWLIGEASLTTRMLTTGLGALLIGLSIPRGAVRERYGTWEPWIR